MRKAIVFPRGIEIGAMVTLDPRVDFELVVEGSLNLKNTLG